MEEANTPPYLIHNWGFWFQKIEKVELLNKIRTEKVKNYREPKLSLPVAPKAHKLDRICILHKGRIIEKGSEHNRISSSVLKSTRRNQKAFKERKKAFIGKKVKFIADNRD